MADLAPVRERYAATPRRLDDELRRRARGDRSCVADLVAGVGAISALGAALAAAGGLVPVGVIFVGVGLLGIGFVVGMVAQLRSGKLRRAAIESAPLVGAWAVAHEPELTTEQRQVRWGRVVFCTDPARRFDVGYLRRVARHVTDDRQRSDDVWATVRALPDQHAQTLLALPEGGPIEPDTWIADVMVYPDRLAGGQLDPKAPTLALIADVDRRFVEHI